MQRHSVLSLESLVLSGHHSLLSVYMLFPQVLWAFVHGIFRNENAKFTERIFDSLFTIYSRANGSVIQDAAKGGRQKEFDHSFGFSGLFRSLFGHFF